MNYEDLKYFLALARYGRLTLAADRLGVEHSTIRRRISALEQDLGSRLFDNTAKGWQLTSLGQRLLPFAQNVEEQAEAGAASVTNRNQVLQGVVRILTTDGFGGSILAPGLRPLQIEQPEIQIELVTNIGLLSHGVGEFDIAVSIHPPQRHDLHIAKLCEYELRFYASKDYLDRAPELTTVTDLPDQEMIWFIDSLLDLPELKNLGDSTAMGKNYPQITFRTTNMVAQVEATAAGIGLGLLPSFLAHEDERLVPVLHDQVSMKRTFWIIVPKRMLNTERVNVVVRHIRQIADDNQYRLIPAIESQ